MERRLTATLLLGVVATFAPSADASQCPSTNVITDPADFVWDCSGGCCTGTMEISEQTFNINGDTLTTRAYGQAGTAPTIPGPTMRVTPGTKYILKFHNKLPYEPMSTEHNVFKDPNVSNLHTHGLHISGESPGDDVTRSFEGGVHLWPGAVQYHRAQAQAMQKGQRRGQLVQVVAQDPAADLHHGES